MEPSLDLFLSHDNLLEVPCDKDKLVDDALVLHVLEPVTCAENKHVIHIATKTDEFKLLSSLHTLGYIEFDVLCNLDCLEESLFKYADLPWFSKHTYHVIGKYNNKGQYMIHRVYIRSNMNSPFVVQDYDRLEGSHNNTNIFSCSLKKQVHFQEGEHCWLLPMSARPSIPALSLVSSNLLQDSIDIHRVHSDHGVYMLAKIFMRDDMLEIWNMVMFLLTIILVFFVLATPFSFMLCRISFKYNRRRGRLFVKKGRMMRHDTHAYDHIWCMVWRGRRPAKVSKSRRRPEANSVRVPEVEAQSNSSSSLPRPLGPICLKLVTQDVSGLRFR